VVPGSKENFTWAWSGVSVILLSVVGGPEGGIGDPVTGAYVSYK